MTQNAQEHEKVVHAALALAEKTPWRRVGMADIAAVSGVTLIELASIIQSKCDIICLYNQSVDQKLLQKLAAEPVTGGGHDRLFDVIMQRLELMEPERAGLAHIVAQPLEGPSDAIALYNTLHNSMTWMLAAGGLEDEAHKHPVRGMALVAGYIQVLRVWVTDDDPGKAKTMAVLDRKLRDGAEWRQRVNAPVALVKAVGKLARQVFENLKKGAAQSAEQTTAMGQANANSADADADAKKDDSESKPADIDGDREK